MRETLKCISFALHIVSIALSLFTIGYILINRNKETE